MVLAVQVCVHCHGGTGPVAGVLPRSLPQPVCGELSQDGAKAAWVFWTRPADHCNILRKCSTLCLVCTLLVCAFLSLCHETCSSRLFFVCFWFGIFVSRRCFVSRSFVWLCVVVFCCLFMFVCCLLVMFVWVSINIYICGFSCFFRGRGSCIHFFFLNSFLSSSSFSCLFRLGIVRLSLQAVFNTLCANPPLV